MKKYLVLLVLFMMGYSSTFATVEDTSVLDQLNGTATKTSQDFKLRKFSSCQNVEDIMNKYVQEYYKNNPPIYYGRGGGPVMMEDAVAAPSVWAVAKDSNASVQQTTTSGSSGWNQDYSKTNTQVSGVDESDIVKTDGTYIYYMSDSYDAVTGKQSKYVFIAKATPAKGMEVLRKIKIPDTFYNTDLYITDNKLVILSTGSNQYDYSRFWINRNQRTFVMVFDKTDINNLKLQKLYVVDGYYTKSRKIGDTLYVISNNSISFPYYNYPVSMAKGGIAPTATDVPVFDIKNAMPKEIDISRDDNGTLKIKGQSFPYNIQTGDVANCNEVQYFLPDEDTMKKYTLQPNYNIISMIDLAHPTAKVKNKVIFGSLNEVYMSEKNLYITSNLYENNTWQCPVGAMCMRPWYPTGENTLIHKLNVSGLNVDYQDSAVVPGSPLTQYSMDEKDDNFRIITSQWSPDRQSNLYILDSKLNQLSALEGLGKWEGFQSSRYISDKLFMVTFKQTDPFTAIDLADPKNPKILWELKIPWYSTYLHPYDDTHIIGLGYDTTTNQWGGTQQNGLKVDLYEVNYDKKCGDSNLTSDEKKGCSDGTYKWIIVKQLQTKSFGNSGSYSEALNNPRMFVWNAAKKLLLLPATIYSSAPATPYVYTDFFNGMLGINIDTTGIWEKFRVSHIDTAGLEEKRKTDCAPYLTTTSTAGQCRKLLDGTQYCPPVQQTYVPEYCYADSSLGSYLAQTSWNFSQSFIKRALYIGDNAYAISDKKIGAYDIGSGKELGTVDLK